MFVIICRGFWLFSGVFLEKVKNFLGRKKVFPKILGFATEVDDCNVVKNLGIFVKKVGKMRGETHFPLFSLSIFLGFSNFSGFKMTYVAK